MESINLTEIVVAIIGLLGASGGFWAWISARRAADSATTRLIMGLALDRIVQTGTEFVQREWITAEEYGDYRKYLVDPYKKLGGNGTADKIMVEVDKLPMHAPNRPQPAVTFQLQREANTR